MTGDLFENFEEEREQLGPGAVLLRRFGLSEETPLLTALDAIVAQAPFRHMVTPGGFSMSVAMTNCGSLGWIADRKGYRYDAVDPIGGKAWPPLPPTFLNLATGAAAQGGFSNFVPDACLINCYEPGAKLTLHQDKEERDFSCPIVSVSLGLPAMFQFGGFARADKVEKIKLTHGDVVVWGGPDRLRYHGVLPLKAGQHPLLGSKRINLTFRRAG